jgi:hypothetical protein
VKRFFVCVLAVQLAAAPLASSIAAAPKSGQDDEAAKLKKQGDTAMMDLRYDDAIAAYEASYAIHPNPALHYNRGRAFEALGRFADALKAYESFMKLAPADLKAKVPQMAQHIEEVRKKVTHLTLSVKPAGAKVLLRGVMLGSAPLGTVGVNAGSAKLEIMADGYAPYAKEIELPGGQSMTLEVELTPKADKVATVVVLKSDPAATATIDGKIAGTTPIETAIAPGTHTLELARDGYTTRQSSFVVAAGERKELSFTLESSPGLTSHWWFWTGAAVVTAGAAALTIGLLTSRDAGRGDIAPGRVAAPLLRF